MQGGGEAAEEDKAAEEDEVAEEDEEIESEIPAPAGMCSDPPHAE